ANAPLDYPPSDTRPTRNVGMRPNVLEGPRHGAMVRHRGVADRLTDLRRLLLVVRAPLPPPLRRVPTGCLPRAGVLPQHRLPALPARRGAGAQLQPAAAADALRMHLHAVSAQLRTLRPLCRSYQRRSSASQRPSDRRAITSVAAAISTGPASHAHDSDAVAAL